MASSRARGAPAAACARVAVVSMLAWLALLPAPALAAGHAAPHAAHGRGHSQLAPGHSQQGPGNSQLAPGHATLPAAVFGRGGAATERAVSAPAGAAPAPAPASAPAIPAPAATAGPPTVAAPRAVAPVARPVAAGLRAGAAPGVAVAAPPPAAVAAARRNPGLETFPPPIVLPPGPEGARVAIALFTLPVLVAVWVWALLRLSVSVWTFRGSGIRTALALQLGVPAEQLAALDLAGLRRLRDGIAFDELTGVLRRAAGLASMERELARSARADHPVCAVFIDVDGLKATNDAFGHEAGDALLRRAASVLRGRLRAQDLIFRYGGDEFVCVMPGTARPRAERIIDDLRRLAAADGLRFSYGVVQAARGEPAADVIARADSLQYVDKEARRTGR